MRVENERGEFFLVESSVHLEVRHGDVPLSRVHAIAPDTVGVLTAEPELEAFDLREAVFLDTETTGLAGGAGTAAFLIGVGWVEGDRFRVRQYFMRDYHEEGALLHALAAELARFDRLVTFNGKMFDVPLLDARFRLNRARFPLARRAAPRPAAPRAAAVEGAARVVPAAVARGRSSWACGATGDIPGEEIPQVYFDWVRRRDARALARVFEHNRQDIVSLAALAVLACQWVEESRAEDPRDIFSLARVLERGRLYERSEAEYRRALSAGSGPTCAARRCCGSAGAPSARATTRAPPSCGRRRARRARSKAGASSRCTTSTAAATSSRRSRRSSAGRASSSRPSATTRARGTWPRPSSAAASGLHRKQAAEPA